MNWKLSSVPRRVLSVLAAMTSLGLIVGVAFSFNAVFASPSRGQMASPPQPSPTSTIDTSQADPTAGWKVYRNEECGFRVKYPPELDRLGKTFHDPTNETLRFSIPTQHFEAFDPYSFTFLAKKLVESETENCESRPGGLRTEDKIEGITFIRIERTEEPDVSDSYDYRDLRIEYIGKHEDICYQFIFFNYLKKKSLADAERKELEKTIGLFERIVSTFKLLESRQK